MRLRGIFEATVGRRLLVRIWFHSVLLLVGVVATVLLGHELTSHKESLEMRSPYLARAVGESVLSHHADRGALDREVHMVVSETLLDVSVFDSAGILLASSVDPPLAAPTEIELGALTPAPERVAWSNDRLVVGRFRDGRLTACAVITKPSRHPVAWHLIGVFMAALILAFVFVAAP